MTSHETRTLRAVFTVVVETKPGGDYYFDHDDFVRNVVPWIEGALDDRDDIRNVTITEAAAVSVPPPVIAPDDDGIPAGPCDRCKGSGIDPEDSYPAQGPDEYSMGEPPVLEPCRSCSLPPRNTPDDDGPPDYAYDAWCEA